MLNPSKNKLVFRLRLSSTEVVRRTCCIFSREPRRKAEYILFTLLPFFILGHINHSFFWKILAPTTNGGGQLYDGKLKSTLDKDFGSVEGFKQAFNAKAAALQGSGWCWLVRISLEY